MSTIGPEQFRQQYGGDLERIKKESGALRIYKYYSSITTAELYWLGSKRYDRLWPSESVISPELLWTDPTLEAELQHPDERLLLSLEDLMHHVSGTAKWCREQAAFTSEVFKAVSSIRESCREWEHHLARMFPVRCEALKASSAQLDCVLAVMNNDSVLSTEQVADRLCVAYRIINYTFYEAIALRDRVREARPQ